MAKFGYILTAPGYETLEADRRRMQELGCVEIIVEERLAGQRTRPLWDALTRRLAYGDWLVIPRLANALHGARQLVFFLEFCRVEQIRLIALHDRIDWGNELFPDTRTSDVLTAIALLPKEVGAMHRHAPHIDTVRRHIDGITQKGLKRATRNQRIVNMYLEGYSIDDIHAASGFRSRSSIFRILNNAGVSLTRGHTRGPLGPRKKNPNVTPSSETTDE